MGPRPVQTQLADAPGLSMTAYQEQTTPAGATPPLPEAWGMVRVIVPTSAGRWSMPAGQGGLR
ncbi:protein of unknown function [Ralstonia solanacearum CMR15]|nr:protein of unknown function [Ralstonia solanacearum CMR15]